MMEYDRGDSFPQYFDPNGFLFGSKLKGKLSPVFRGDSFPSDFKPNGILFGSNRKENSVTT